MLEHKEMELISKSIGEFTQAMKRLGKAAKIANRKIHRFVIQSARRKPLIHKGKKP